uniref:Ubiquitin-associated protein 2-like n=1 Tax=Sinocyclocheilus anshuiensis TaxID=1608454 RepID=A0A671RAR5_9TELE
MMTSVVTDAAKGNRDRALPQTTHTSQPQKQIQATAEQIRLAQMIYDKNDADFEGKVQQLMEVTGKNQDECMVALHDCNGDVNRAINFLLEEVTVKDSWETVGKKKSVGKEGTAPESREKRGEKEGRGRGGPNRCGRGTSHNQEGRSEENGFDSAPGVRGGDRGHRGRGRGKCIICTPRHYCSLIRCCPQTRFLRAWKDSLEDWVAEDWNEDFFFVFFQLLRMVLGSLLSKVAEGDSELSGLEPSSPDTLTQSLVFTNSQQHATRTHTHSYASAAAGTYAHAASVRKTGTLTEIDTCWNMFFLSLVDLKAQPDPSPILGRLTQHQNAALQSDLPAQARDPSPFPPHDGPSPTLKPNCEPVVTSTEPPQPRNIRPQRRRAPPPSKIPSSAVEMPGSADVSGLNVQFGALDFGSESTVENLNQSESSFQEPVGAPQTQSSLYSKPTTISESLGGLPPAVMESSYPSASLGLPSTTAPPVLASSSASRVASSATTPLAAPSSTPQPISTALPTENSLSSSSLSSSSSSTAAPALSTTQMGTDVNVSLSTYSGAVSSVSSSTVNSNDLSAGTQSLNANGASAPSAVRSAPLQTNITPSNTSGKAPPNLAQGVPPLLASQYIMGPGGLLPAYPPIYGYEDLQMMQSRLPMDYYGMTFPGTALAGRDGGLANNPYSGEPTKFGRSDSNSPAPATSLSSVPPSQSQQSAVPPQNQGPQNPGQAQQGQTQAFLNPPLPPGYGYTSLLDPEYTTTVFFQMYFQEKHISFDKHGFPTAAGPAFSLPSALGGTGPLNPAGAPGYAPAPFLHILPHQQPPSQLLHHHMAQDTQGQRSQANSMQKSQGKSNHSSSPYWAN